jgi:hypothetical protein
MRELFLKDFRELIFRELEIFEGCRQRLRLLIKTMYTTKWSYPKCH